MMHNTMMKKQIKIERKTPARTQLQFHYPLAFVPVPPSKLIWALKQTCPIFIGKQQGKKRREKKGN